MAASTPTGHMAVVLDNSGAHTSQHVTWLDGIEPVPLPADSPELNKGERWLKEVREPLSNQVHDHREALEASLTQALRPYWQQPSTLVQLTADPWWREGVQHIMRSGQ